MSADIPTDDVYLICEVADSAVHYTRHGHYQVGIVAAREIFRQGLDAVEVLLARWAATAAYAIDSDPRCAGLVSPVWPKPCGAVTTNISMMSPPSLWAGRYIAAIRRNDFEYAADLLEAIQGEALAAAAESLLTITALWVDLREKRTQR